jgi:hypothetical protein
MILKIFEFFLNIATDGSINDFLKKNKKTLIFALLFLLVYTYKSDVMCYFLGHNFIQKEHLEHTINTKTQEVKYFCVDCEKWRSQK